MNTELLFERIIAGRFEDEEAKSIDKLPLIDELRSLTNKSQAELFLKRCFDDKISDESKCLYISLLRNFSSEEKFRSSLKELWPKSNPLVKEALMWRILDNVALELEWHKEIYKFVLDTNEIFAESTMIFFGEGKEGVKMAKKRLADKSFPAFKKWVYLCRLVLYKETSYSEIKQILEFENENNEYEFVRNVAGDLLVKYFNN